MARLTIAEFDRRFTRLYPALRAHARARIPDTEDADALTHDAYLNARDGLDGFDDADDPARFARWCFRILDNALADHFRRERRRAVSLADLPEDAFALRWAALAADSDRAEVADIELRHEARWRLRLADLTQEERACLSYRLEGLRYKAITGQTGLSRDAVRRRLLAAIAKLRRVPATLLHAPDLERYRWKAQNLIAIYHAPTATGAALARERLARLK